MKKICTLILLIFTLLLTGCSKKLDPRVYEKLENNTWEYSTTTTTYKPIYDSEYWNSLDDRYEKMYYEATLNADFSEEIQKNIYLFYGDEANDFDYKSLLRGIQYARLDHPELEVMNMDFNNGFVSSSETGYIYYEIAFHSYEYDEYLTKMDEINAEIKDLVEEVNNTEDIIEKHSLIFKWITSNVKYLKTGEEIGTIDFWDDEFVLAHTMTNSTQNIYGAIVEKEAVCDGIADAYKYICNQCGLECIIIDGYISEQSEDSYHAWNLIKVYDEWYLIDATWNLGEDFKNYFMVKYLDKGDRIPLYYGTSLPGYDDDDANKITLFQNSENSYSSEDGIKISLEDKNYDMSEYDGDISISLSSLGWKHSEDNIDVFYDVLFKTNTKILSFDYFDGYGSLIRHKECGRSKISNIILPRYISGTYVDSMLVKMIQDGKEYKLNIFRGGL